MSNEPQPLTDLIPKSHGPYWGAVLLSFGVMAVLCYGYIKMPGLAEKIGTERIAPLDLNAAGSLFAWWMSILWLFAAAVAWFNFKRRRREKRARREKNEKESDPADPQVHRDRSWGDLTDIWLWGTLACLFLCADASVRLREVLCDVLFRYGGAQFNGSGDFWWIGLYAMFFFGLIGTRLILEMRRFWPATGFFSVSMLLFAAAGALQLGLLNRGESLKPEETVMLRCVMEMGATVLLLISLTVFARHLVLLDPNVVLRWLGTNWTNREVIATVETAPRNAAETKPAPTVQVQVQLQDSTPPKPPEHPAEIAVITANHSGVNKPPRPVAAPKVPAYDQPPEELARRRHAAAEQEV